MEGSRSIWNHGKACMFDGYSQWSTQSTGSVITSNIKAVQTVACHVLSSIVFNTRLLYRSLGLKEGRWIVFFFATDRVTRVKEDIKKKGKTIAAIYSVLLSWRTPKRWSTSLSTLYGCLMTTMVQYYSRNHFEQQHRDFAAYECTLLSEEVAYLRIDN